MYLCPPLPPALLSAGGAPPQRVRPAGCGASGPVLQAGRADGHEAAHVRAEELEQRHLSAAGGSGQAPGLHRSHVQPDAADGHVDGTPTYAQELGLEGTGGERVRSDGGGTFLLQLPWQRQRKPHTHTHTQLAHTLDIC